MPDDGTKKIFLYTFGDSRGESPEMVRFLKYLQNPSNTAGDTLLEEISRAVQYEKQSPRAKEAYRLGFTKIALPKRGNLAGVDVKGAQIIPLGSVYNELALLEK